MTDEAFLEMLMGWGITPNGMLNGTLLIVLFAMVYLNVYMYRKYIEQRNRLREDSTLTMDWSQGGDEIEIDIPLPTPRPWIKDIECHITSETIRFAFKGDKEPMLDGKLYRKVVPDDCNWQLWPVGPDPTHVKVTLTKASQGTWKAVLAEDATGKLQVDDGPGGKGKPKRA